MGCLQSQVAQIDFDMPLVPQEAPQKPAWPNFVVDREDFKMKVFPGIAISLTGNKVKDDKDNVIALVDVHESHLGGPMFWKICDPKNPKEVLFQINAGNEDGTYFLKDMSWNGVIAGYRKKHLNSDSEVEVFDDGNIGESKARMFTSIGNVHNMMIVNHDGELVARADPRSLWVSVAKGCDAIFILALYLIREKFDNISESFA